MNSLPPSISRRASHRWLWMLASCALLLNGCITSQEVSTIVRDSNYQMLLASSPGLETGLATNPEEGPNAAMDDAAMRINVFLEAHRDDPVMASTLRLRQTLLYLNQRALALADSAIQQVDQKKLPGPRDQALVAAYPDLRWWAEFAHTAEITFSTTQKAAALEHIAALEQHAAKLAASPDLRDYFLEMRAWIGLKLGLATFNNPTFKRDTIQNAITPWAETFTPAELTLLGATDFKNVKAFDLSTRRVLRARALLTKLAQQNSGPTRIPLTFSRPAFQEYYDALPR